MKPIEWIGSSRDDIRGLPGRAQDVLGYSVPRPGGREGGRSDPFAGIRWRGVLEIIEDYDGRTFRAVYTVRFARAVYVLHVFQRRSKKGIATPQQDKDLILARLKAAGRHYERHYR